MDISTIISVKKGKIMAVGIAFILFLSGCGSGEKASTITEDTTSNLGASTSTTTEKFDLDEYRTLVSKCNEDIMVVALLVSNMGTYEYNYWKSLNSIAGSRNTDYDSMVSKASDWLNKKANEDIYTLEIKYQAICEQYKEIITKEIDGKEAEEIKAEFKELFDSFNALYLLVTEPSGGVSDFANNLNEQVKSVTSSNSKLSILLGN